MVTASNNYLMTVADNAPEPIDVVYRDSTGIPISLVGYSLKMQIRSKKSSASTLYATLTDDVDGGIEVTNAAGGEFVISFSPTVIADLTFSGAYYDVVITDPSGDPHRIMEGKIVIDRGVTV